MNTLYFDYNATTPLDDGVREAMLPFLTGIWGNPSSIHHVGQQARACLDDAHERAARVLRCKNSELVFTSGGTESANLAVLGTARAFRDKGRHLIASAIEHHAVLAACDYLVKHEGFALTLLPVDPTGLTAPEDLRRALRTDTVLVSIMAANNEIGTVQPVAALGAVCREHGVFFHTDAVQWFGKEPFNGIEQFNADLVSICAHKIHGPKGTGALFIRSPLRPHSLLLGGGHENEFRAGTENLAGIAGFVASLERFVRDPVFPREPLWTLTQRLGTFLEGQEGVRRAGSREHGLANTVAVVVEGTDSIALLAALDLEGICASSGSACSAGSLEPSHVIRALGMGEALARSLLRFSLGRDSTAAGVARLEQVLPAILRRSRGGALRMTRE